MCAPRRLSIQDIPACMDLAVNRRWPRELEKWKLLLSCGEAWGIDDPDGGLAAAVALLKYPPALAIVGMLMVHDRRGRAGLGRRLMEHLLKSAGSEIVMLYSTDMGRPLYEKLGFVTVDGIAKHFGRLQVDSVKSPRPFAPSDFDAVLDLDLKAFGADRSALLRGLVSIAQRVLVLEKDGVVSGYGIAWQNVDRIHLGPIVAPDEDGSRALIAGLGYGQGLPVRVDIAERWTGLSSWLQERGLESRGITPLMTVGAERLPGDRSLVVASAMLATG